MYVCKVDYCDYVIWTQKGLHVERLVPDNDLIESIITKSKAFFQYAVLPELLGSYFSRPNPHAVNRAIPNPITLPPKVEEIPDENNNSPPPSAKLYCFCQTPYDDTKSYIGCDNSGCKYEWFHLKCVKIKKIPSGDWF